MYLRYYLNTKGERVYTFKVPTISHSFSLPYSHSSILMMMAQQLTLLIQLNSHQMTHTPRKESLARRDSIFCLPSARRLSSEEKKSLFNKYSLNVVSNSLLTPSQQPQHKMWKFLIGWDYWSVNSIMQ
jgi:hypothetical protein